MFLPDYITKKFKLPEQKLDKIFQELESRYPNKDPWGLDVNKAKKYFKFLYPLYRNYWKVRVFGQEKIDQNTPYMFIGNHTGQIALDAMLMAMAGVLDFQKPRLLRAMIERWMTTLPFIAEMAAAGGAILGDRKNCQYLLDHGESIMVFPEGVKGIAKNTENFYELQVFTSGFYRLAAKNKTPIIPVAIIGAEEMYPFVHHSKVLAKSLELPAFPMTPTWPWFGPLGLLPLPSPIDIYFGEPVYIPEHITENSADEIVNEKVLQIKNTIKEMIEIGLKKRRPFLENFGLKDQRKLKN